MKLPSCTVRMRSLVESNVNVSVIVEIRAASLIEIGMMYGPPPTRNVVPLGDMTMRAVPMPGDVMGGSVAAGGAGGCASGVVGVVGAGWVGVAGVVVSGGGVVVGGVVGAGVVAAGGVAGGS